MSFKDSLLRDIKKVFLSTAEFADTRKITYDGTVYDNIPVVLTGIAEKDRSDITSNHSQGLYCVTHTMHFAQSDLGGKLPEKGTKIRVSEGSYFREFYVASSAVEMGMLRLELEAIDE